MPMALNRSFDVAGPFAVAACAVVACGDLRWTSGDSGMSSILSGSQSSSSSTSVVVVGDDDCTRAGTLTAGCSTAVS